MYRFLVKFTAVLMTLFYMVAVGGFDVHSDHESGQVYFRLLSAGISCDAVHPDAPCHHNHAEGCEEEEDCCSDNILVLSIAGDGGSSDEFLPQPSVCFCAELPCAACAEGQPFRVDRPLLPLPRGIPPKLLLHRICIMRV